MKILIVTVLAFLITAQWEVAAECCEKIRVDREDGGSTVAWAEQPKMWGVYQKNAGTIGGRNWWQSIDEDYAIWYTSDKWRIGQVKRVGSTTQNAYTIDIDQCVEDTKLNWQFYESDADKWIFANDGLGTYCAD